MYEKFKTCVRKEVNINPYFDGKYYVEKEIITTWLYHRYFDKILKIEFHFAEITDNIDTYLDYEKQYKKIIIRGNSINTFNQFSDMEDYQDKYFEVKKDLSLDNQDLTEELEIYCPSPDLKNYMLMKVYHRDELYPPFYGFALFHTAVSLHIFSINKRNFITFKTALKIVLEAYLKEGIISNNVFLNFFKDMSYLGDLVEEYRQIKGVRYEIPMYASIQPPLPSDFSKENIDQFHKSQKRVTTYGDVIEEINFFLDKKKGMDEKNDIYKYFLRFPLSVFVQLLRQNEEASICQYCGQIMKYHPTKKHCNLKQDGRNCVKIAANRRNYLKNEKVK